MATADVIQPTAPSLSYDPDFDDYNQRKERRLAPETIAKDLPAGFPPKFETPSAWKGSDWTDDSKFVYSFSTEDIRQIDEALTHFKSTCPPACRLRDKTII